MTTFETLVEARAVGPLQRLRNAFAFEHKVEPRTFRPSISFQEMLGFFCFSA